VINIRNGNISPCRVKHIATGENVNPFWLAGTCKSHSRWLTGISAGKDYKALEAPVAEIRGLYLDQLPFKVDRLVACYLHTAKPPRLYSASDSMTALPLSTLEDPLAKTCYK
jgi:hypothetical protein